MVVGLGLEPLVELGLVRIYRAKMSSAPNVIREARMVLKFSGVNAAGYSESFREQAAHSISR